MARARRVRSTAKGSAASYAEQVLASVVRRLQRVRQFEAAAGAYLAELMPFSLPPEAFQMHARPDFYITGVFIPHDRSWADARAHLHVLLEGTDDEREFGVGGQRLAELIQSFSLNLNYALVHVPDSGGWRVRPDLAFGERTVLLESRWGNTGRSTAKWVLRRRPRNSWVPPMSTLVIP